MNQPITLTMTQEEYKRVIILSYLGEWVINATRKDPDPGFQETAEKVYAAAQETSLESLVVFDRDHGAWLASEKLEEHTHPMIDEYDDKTFWEELTARLVERDLIARQGERVVRSLRPDQRVRAAKPLAQAYTEEFENHGLSRLFVAE